MKIIDSFWFGLVGIVKIHNGFETKWYIGQGIGTDQKADELHIAQYGKPFRPKEMQWFFTPATYLDANPIVPETPSDNKSYM